MPRPLRIEISEREDTLKRLLRQQASGRRKERLQALYWLKSGQVTTWNVMTGEKPPEFYVLHPQAVTPSTVEMRCCH